MTAYAELAATTHFSFLAGASSPADMVMQAIALGMTGIGIADRNSVAGVVRAHVALQEAREAGASIDFRLAVGSRLVFADGTPDIIVYPEHRRGWGRLTRLLTIGNLRGRKGECILRSDDLVDQLDGLLALVLPGQGDEPALASILARLGKAAPGSVWLAATMLRHGRDHRRLAALSAIAADTGIPLLAVNDALYATPAQRRLHDVMICIREKTTLAEAGRRLRANAERHLKTPAEMARLFAAVPEAVAETQTVLARAAFSLDALRYEYPHEPVPAGYSAQAWLEALCLAKAAERWPDGVPDRVRQLLDEEFRVVARARYAPYFLTVHDIVSFAQARGILCQGRGSAANSMICFVLGITAVDPAKYNLLFSRFISEERREPPDIDVDFEHERREEVMQYVYQRYGRHRAGIVATVIHYRPRSAVREVGKVLGLSEDVTERIASTVWGSYGSDIRPERYREIGLDPDNPEIERLDDLVGQILEFPRHLSQHVGGFVLTEDRLDETVPIHNAAMADRTCIEWDKDDIDALGLMKVDVLALGMLTCIRKAFALIETHAGRHYTLDSVPDEDAAVYAMLQKGDSVGVFQVESRAQMNMLPRLKPAEFYDLAIQVAIVRPGPIQGDMVHPYLRRRQGYETVDYPAPAPPHDAEELKQVLGKTLGVPLFQEQAMKLAIVAADFTPSEANQLRRAMATFRNLGTIDRFRDKLVGGMVARGYDADFAARCFKQIEGFGSYGFPESHAIAFARLVWVSSWIKCHYPAIFCAALLNAQPMGFYAPAQIVRDAREHGVVVSPVDINQSGWDNSLEHDETGRLGVRLGFRQVTGFREEWAARLSRSRPFASLEDAARRARLPAGALRLAADADACRSMGLDRREALWAARRIPGDELPLFAAAAAAELGDEPDALLPAMREAEHVAADYQVTRLSLKNHPMHFLRPVFAAEGVKSCAAISAARDGARIRTAGVVLIRQRPGKGNAIFVTLEDETGIANIIIWARLFERYRRQVMAARLMLVEGMLQKSPEGVIHVMAGRIFDRTAELGRLSATHDPDPPLSPADEFLNPPHPRSGHPRNVRILPRSRDFH
jgi:error-prone DNA polymerase